MRRESDSSLQQRAECVRPVAGNPALPAAIETERARAWTVEKTADFPRTHYMLRRELGAQWTQRPDEILEQAQPLMD
jgi:hypothetical protein